MIEIICQLDVTEIKEELEKVPSQAWKDSKVWSKPKDLMASNIGNYSKKQGHSVIREQDRILLIWHKDRDGLPWFEHKNYREFETGHTSWAQYFPKTLKLLQDYFKDQNQKITRLYFSKLDSQKQIYPHRDEKFFPVDCDFEHVRRFGLCVTTNEDCRLICGDTDMHIDQGILYYIDNMQIHSATNFGPSSRTHMYIDVTPVKQDFEVAG